MRVSLTLDLDEMEVRHLSRHLQTSGVSRLVVIGRQLDEQLSKTPKFIVNPLLFHVKHGKVQK